MSQFNGQQQQYDVNHLAGQMENMGIEPTRHSVSGSVAGASSRKKRPVYVVDENLSTTQVPTQMMPPMGAPGGSFTPIQSNYQSGPVPHNGAVPSEGQFRPISSSVSLPASGQFYQNPQQFQSQVFENPLLLQQHQQPSQGFQGQFSQGLSQGQPNSTISTIPEIGSNQPYSPEDSLQIPSLRAEAHQERSQNKEFLTFQNVHPPMIGVQAPHFVDQGVTTPNFMRLSLYSVPATNDMFKAARLPLGMMVRPFAPTGDDEEVPVVDLTEVGGPPRCRRCRAYVNPQMQFNSSFKMICNMCQFASDCPPGYGSTLDASGRRDDILQRPELHKGTVDFIVPKEYNVNPERDNSPLNYVFLIDLSESALLQGLQRCIGDCLRQAIYNGGESNLPEGSKICLIGYDKKLFFYDLSPSLQLPSVSTVSDIDDPFIPFYQGLFVDPVESRSIIEDTLNMIESRDHFKVPEPCFGSALKLSLLALESFGGGKVVSILTSLPTSGAGALKYKDPNSGNSFEREKALLTTTSQFYINLAADFNKFNIGLDLFVISSTTVDLANTGLITFKTGGNLRLYQNFNLERDERKLVFEFKSSIANDVGYQGQLKIRCSSGLQVSKYYGNFFQKDSSDPAIATLNTEQTYMADFLLDDKLNPKYDAHFQAALLYTDKSGNRKVRVINMVCAVTQRVGDIFASADQDTIINLWMKQQLDRLPNATLQTLRNFSNTELVNAFTQYRALVAGSHALSQQFIIPETLKALTMYLLGFQKSRLARSLIPNGDSKVQNWQFLNGSTFEKISFNLYPMIVAIHELEDEECSYTEDGIFRVPHQTRLTLHLIQQGGCYLGFNGQKIVLWIHPQVNPLLLQDLFGEHIEKFDDISPIMDELPRLQTHISEQVHNLIGFITKNYLGLEFAPVLICRVGIDGSEYEFMEMLVEDATRDKIVSYTEYLAHIHKSVKDKLANEKPKKAESSVLGTDMNTFAQKWLH